MIDFSTLLPWAKRPLLPLELYSLWYRPVFEPLSTFTAIVPLTCPKKNLLCPQYLIHWPIHIRHSNIHSVYAFHSYGLMFFMSFLRHCMILSVCWVFLAFLFIGPFIQKTFIECCVLGMVQDIRVTVDRIGKGSDFQDLTFENEESS